MIAAALGYLTMATMTNCTSARTDTMSNDRETAAPKAEQTAPAAPPLKWTVWQGNFRVLTIVGEPGPLISTAPPPPGGGPLVQHPFLSATAELPTAEHELRELLLKSTSVDEYLEHLRGAGFRVQAETNAPRH